MCYTICEISEICEFSDLYHSSYRLHGTTQTPYNYVRFDLDTYDDSICYNDYIRSMIVLFVV